MRPRTRLRVVEVGMLRPATVAELALGVVDPAGVDEHHRALVEQHRIVRACFAITRSMRREGFVVASFLRGQLGEKELVGLVRELLRACRSR